MIFSRQQAVHSLAMAQGVSAADGRQTDVIWTDRWNFAILQNFFFFSLLPLPPLPTRASSTLELLVDILSGRSRTEKVYQMRTAVL